MTGVTIITGASRGIGRAVAIALAAPGETIVVNYAGNDRAAAQTVAMVETRGAKAVAVQGDMGLEKDIVALFAAAERLGPLTGFVANAGIVAPVGRVESYSLERVQRMMAVNVVGVILGAREAVRRMSTKQGGKGGTIVLMGSIAARLGSPGEFADYAASKGAVDSFAVGLAREVGGEGIRVNAVRPGLIDTDIHLAAGVPDRAARLGATVPLGRAGRAEEIADAVAWLMSDKSSYVTGALIDVTGGR